MKRLLILALALLALTSCRKAAPENGPRATITPRQGTFWFPVANANDMWKWGTSSDDGLEYAWMVRVGLSEKTYEFGYTKWKFAQAQPAQGDLSWLLVSGQSNVWLDRKVISRPFAVRTTQEGLGVTISLNDPNLLAAFAAQRPASVTFYTEGELMQKTEQAVKVTYSAN